MSHYHKPPGGLLVLVGIVLVLFPAMYVLSIAPAAYLNARATLSDEWADQIYWPLQWLADRSELFRRVGEDYAQFGYELADDGN